MISTLETACAIVRKEFRHARERIRLQGAPLSRPKLVQWTPPPKATRFLKEPVGRDKHEPAPLGSYVLETDNGCYFSQHELALAATQHDFRIFRPMPPLTGCPTYDQLDRIVLHRCLLSKDGAILDTCSDTFTDTPLASKPGLITAVDSIQVEITLRNRDKRLFDIPYATIHTWPVREPACAVVNAGMPFHKAAFLQHYLATTFVFHPYATEQHHDTLKDMFTRDATRRIDAFLHAAGLPN